MPRRMLLGGAAASLVGVAPVGAPAGAADAAGAVDALRGQGYAVATAQRRALAIASAVFVGDLIGTLADSTMGLTLGAATQVRLGPEARLTIDRFILKAGGVLVLENGGMLVDHATAAGGIDLKVRSRFGLIAIRGTRFFAGPSNGAFGVFVQRGAVEVEGGSARVRLEAGMGTSIATPGAAPGAAVVWSAARIAAALALVGAG